MSKYSISILIPVRNEVGVIEKVIQEWINLLEEHDVTYCIFIEDGGSTDGTVEKLELAKKQNKNISVSCKKKADGFKNAIHRLLVSGDSDWYFIADADDQYEVDDFRYFIEFINNYDEGTFSNRIQFVKGVKINRQDGGFRRIFSFIINYFIVIYFGFPFADYNSSHYMLHNNLKNQILRNGIKFRYLINIEIALQAILSNNNYRLIYVKHKKREIGFSRGNPPLKFLKYGLITFLDIIKLKKRY